MKPSFTRRLTVVLYLTGGLPFGLFFETLPTLLRMHQTSLAHIGLLSATSLPYSMKLLWSPLMDRSQHIERWLRAILFGLAATILGLAWAAQSRPSPQVWLWMMGALALGSATLDTAADGLFVKLHRHQDGKEQTRAGGLRVTSYKIAMTLGGGGTIALGGLLGFGPCFAALALFYVILGLIFPRFFTTLERPPSESLRTWLAGLWQWLQKPGTAETFGFTFLYKLGLATIVPMGRPLWVDRGFHPTQLGLFSAGYSLVGLTLGAWLGAKFCQRLGFVRALLVGALVEFLACCTWTVAVHIDPSIVALQATLLGEALAQGVTTAALMTCLARLCEPEHASTQFAALSATFALTRAVAGGIGGYVADHFGQVAFFTWTPLLTIPSLIFFPGLRRRLKAIGVS